MTKRKPPTLSQHNALKTACLRGHPFDEANTARYRGADGRPMRQCIACRRLRYHATRQTGETPCSEPTTSTTNAPNASARTSAAAPIAAANATRAASK